MKTDALNLNNLLVLVLGIVAFFVVITVVTNQLPTFIPDERAAFFILLLIGFVMCTVGGIGPAVTNLGWTHPLTIIGSVLGVAAMLVAVKVVVGTPILMITTNREAVIALAVIGLVKVLINLGYSLLFHS